MSIIGEIISNDDYSRVFELIGRPEEYKTTLRRVNILLGVHPAVKVKPGIKTALHGLSMPFQRGLPPSDLALLVCNFDEEPARGHAEVLHGGDLAHGDSGSHDRQELGRH